MRFVFLMDPLDTVKMEKDTSFILMFGAMERGHEVYYLPDGHMHWINGDLKFHVTPVIPQKIAESPFIEKEAAVLSHRDIDAVLVRSDPPFDGRYLFNTWLLDRLPPRVPVVNSPHGLRTVNEKLWAIQFVSLVPPTVVTRDGATARAFLEQHKDIIAKPPHLYGGTSVFRIRKGDPNANVIFETLTDRWKKEIILQEFIPAAQEGDKRVLVLNGEPLGAVLRVHSEEDHRNNFFSGGRPEPCELNERDREIIEALKPELLRLGLYFVGLDIIGDYLIEINVTSPTCLKEINMLYNKNLEQDVIASVEQLAREKNNNKEIVYG